MKISQFYKNDYANAALYQSFRTIGSAFDGQKVGARKILFTMDKKNITENIKVANLAADVSSLTEFIHGSGSLEGAIVTLAQDFGNNYPLIMPEGSFGTRFNRSAAASRYIFTKKSPWFDRFFHEDDKKLIEYREFEGKSIEPFFYIPVLPVLLLNGNSGIGNGYAQKILPRKIEDVIKAIDDILKGKEPKRIAPWFNGFKGSVKHTEDNRVEIIGTIVNNITEIIITEVPFSYELAWYVAELDKLVEKGTIKDYKDLSDEGNFKFEIKCTREFGKQTEEEILNQLKLIDRQCENFTCVSEKDSIVEFENEIDLLKSFIKIRKEFYIKRKVYLLSKYEDENLILKNRIRFIESIMNDTLVIFKKTKVEVQDILEKAKFDKLETYEYLLEMRIDSFTKEKIEKMKSLYEEKNVAISTLKSKTEEMLWKEDLAKF